jgi:hypothetical protein
VPDTGSEGILDSTLMKMVRGRWDKRRHDDIIGQMAAAGVVWREIKSPNGGGLDAEGRHPFTGSGQLSVRAIGEVCHEFDT